MYLLGVFLHCLWLHCVNCFFYCIVCFNCIKSVVYCSLYVSLQWLRYILHLIRFGDFSVFFIKNVTQLGLEPNWTFQRLSNRAFVLSLCFEVVLGLCFEVVFYLCLEVVSDLCLDVVLYMSWSRLISGSWSRIKSKAWSRIWTS